MKKLIIAMALALCLPLSGLGFPTNETLLTINIDKTRAFRDGRIKWHGYEDQHVQFTMKTDSGPFTTTAWSWIWKASRRVTGSTSTVYIAKNVGDITLATSNVIFSVPHTSIPPNGTYNWELLLMTATTNLVRNGGQGTLQVLDSLADDADGTWVTGWNTNLTDYLTKVEAAATYSPGSGGDTNYVTSYGDTMTGDLLMSGADIEIPIVRKLALDGDGGNSYLTADIDDRVQVYVGGVKMITIEEALSDSVCINDGALDVDFSVQGDTDTALLFVNAGLDKVGISDSTPDELFTVDGRSSFHDTMQAKYISNVVWIVGQKFSISNAIFSVGKTNNILQLRSTPLGATSTEGSTVNMYSKWNAFDSNRGDFRMTAAQEIGDVLMLVGTNTGVRIKGDAHVVDSDLPIRLSGTLTPALEGAFNWDADDDQYDIHNGTAVYAMPLELSETITIMQPDLVQAERDAVLLWAFESEVYPAGVLITRIIITTSAACADDLNFEEWTTDGSSWTTVATVDAITIGGVRTDAGGITDGEMAADSYLYLDLDGSPTDIQSMEITFHYFINDN